jgi:WD40 repeat protein
MLATASWDESLKLWHLSESMEPTIVHEGTPEDAQALPFNDLALSPDDSVLATNGPGNEVLLWDVKSRKEIRRLSGHKTQVWYVVFSPDGHLASSSFDGSHL